VLDSARPPGNIGLVDNNGQYYSFAKTIVKRSFTRVRNRGGPTAPSQDAMPLEENE
jgi:hypothetical protein